MGPAAESRVKTPVPTRSARATAAAIVAWPQNATSAIGAKYRTCAVVDPVGIRNAVSEYPRSAAMRCMVASSRPVASRTIPAGLPPAGSLENAVYRRISIPPPPSSALDATHHEFGRGDHQIGLGELNVVVASGGD